MNAKKTLMVVLRHAQTLSPAISVPVVPAIAWQVIDMDAMVSSYV